MMIGTKSAATMSTGYLNALAYATERVQGADLAEAGDKSAPRVPIIRHPDVRRMLMEQKATAEGLRALVSYTAAVQGWAETARRPGAGGAWPTCCFRWSRATPPRRPTRCCPSHSRCSVARATPRTTRSSSTSATPRSTRSTRAPPGSRLSICSSARSPATRGRAVQELLGEIRAFGKGGRDDELTADRDRLVGMLDDIEAHLGVMVDHLMASLGGDARADLLGRVSTPTGCSTRWPRW